LIPNEFLIWPSIVFAHCLPLLCQNCAARHTVVNASLDNHLGSARSGMDKGLFSAMANWLSNAFIAILESGEFDTRA
jgi:hypothetical protein